MNVRPIQDTKKEIKKESAGLSPAETKDSCRCLGFFYIAGHMYVYVHLYRYIQYIFIFVLVFVSYSSVRQHPMIFFLFA